MVQLRKKAKPVAARSLQYGKFHYHMARDMILLHFVPERLVELGRERHRSTRTDNGHISETLHPSFLLLEPSRIRVPPDVY